MGKDWTATYTKYDEKSSDSLLLVLSKL